MDGGWGRVSEEGGESERRRTRKKNGGYLQGIILRIKILFENYKISIKRETHFLISFLLTRAVSLPLLRLMSLPVLQINFYKAFTIYIFFKEEDN